MKRLLIVVFALALVPLPGSGQPQPAGYSDAPEQTVRTWYQRYLHREADPQAAVWIDVIKQGQQPEVVLSQILGSSEYYLRAGSSAEGFVRQLHMDLTGRPPGQQEMGYWVNLLYQSDRQDVAYRMLQRYPQEWGASSPDQPWDRPSHDYRRPVQRYYRR